MKRSRIWNGLKEKEKDRRRDDTRKNEKKVKGIRTERKGKEWIQIQE